MPFQMHTLGFFYGQIGKPKSLPGHKNMKKLLIILIPLILFIVSTGQAAAFEKASASSAQLKNIALETEVDNRAEILRAYLEQYDSPLAPFAKDFIASADKYQLDWRLVASISGLESGFGKHIPSNSYNGWGWGIYGDNVLRFKSWPEAIETISKGLRENYLKDKVDSDPYFIGPTYAASPTWAVRVSFFMNQMEEYRKRHTNQTLALAL